MPLVGGLSLPFENETTTQIKSICPQLVGKIYELCSEKLRELDAPRLTHSFFLNHKCKILPFCIFVPVLVGQLIISGI